jgi:hypothetical protein
METQIVPEIDILIGTTKWLISKNWHIMTLSIPHGQGINSSSVGNSLKTELSQIGIDIRNIRLKSSGEDILAQRENISWKIECKGLTGGTLQTIKNNFDRAVASVVSYYTQKENLWLGIALPDSEVYKKYVQAKLPKSLREATNLWVLFYLSKNEVFELAPDEEIPS